MAMLLKDDLPTLKRYLHEALAKLGLKDSAVDAQAIAFSSPGFASYFLKGPSAGRELQTVIIAATDDHLMVIYTHQNFAETPKVVRTDYVPLSEVQLISAREGLFNNVLRIKLHDKTLKLIMAKSKVNDWNDFEGLRASLTNT
jgi:hypothetical protein